MNPFLGSEAIADGVLRKHHLRSQYVALFPGVYLPRGTQPDFRQRAEAAWLWSHRQGVLSGLTASRLHGAKWVDDALPIEVNWTNGRPPEGLKVTRDPLGDGERGLRASLPVTSLGRTAFDVGRRGRLLDAVARLDALGDATGLTADQILLVADAHAGTRGVRQLRRAVELFDPGAQSPRETWLRLLVVGAGYPKPQTQIPIQIDGRTKYYLDMGWPELKLAIEYDGDQHRNDKVQFARDVLRLEELARLGWIVVRVVAGTPSAAVLRRVQAAWEASNVR